METGGVKYLTHFRKFYRREDGKGGNDGFGSTAVDFTVECEWLGRVESGCGAVAVGWACLFPPLSSGGALVAQP